MARPFEAYPHTVLETDATLYEMVNAWAAWKVARQRLAEEFNIPNQDALADAGVTLRNSIGNWHRRIRLLQQCKHLGPIRGT